jgi:hypothetical protein
MDLIVARAHFVFSDLRSGLPMMSDAHDARETERLERRLDEQELASFPASDPHSDWAGPPEWTIVVQRQRQPDAG